MEYKLILGLGIAHKNLDNRKASFSACSKILLQFKCGPLISHFTVLESVLLPLVSAAVYPVCSADA